MTPINNNHYNRYAYSNIKRLIDSRNLINGGNSKGPGPRFIKRSYVSTKFVQPALINKINISAPNMLRNLLIYTKKYIHVVNVFTCPSQTCQSNLN